MNTSNKAIHSDYNTIITGYIHNKDAG